MVKLFWVNVNDVRLAIMARPRGGDWLEDEIDSLRTQSVDTLVSLLTDDEVEELDLVGEAQACDVGSVEYVRFPIEDRSVPTDSTEFRNLLDELEARLRHKKAIAIHCRMGIGRSSLVAACLLRRLGLSCAESFQQIEDARGCPIPDTKAQSDWVEQLSLF